MGMDVYGLNPKADGQGSYFRASVWSWRPIHAICEQVMGITLPWGTNDGEGLKSQEECDELAGLLENFIKENMKGAKQDFMLESPHVMRVDDNGRFLKPGEPGGKSPYSVSREHLQKFITFLRNCGGFEIN